MPRQLKDHILKIWTKNCKGKGEEKEEKYGLIIKHTFFFIYINVLFKDVHSCEWFGLLVREKLLQTKRTSVE